MNIAQQVKTFGNGDVNLTLVEADRLGDANQDWENESTEFDFEDGSVMIICGNCISIYASR